MAGMDHPGPINLGNPTELTVRQIAEDVVAATGSRSAIRYVERPVDDPQVRRPDTTRAREVLGWAAAGQLAGRTGADRGLVRQESAASGIAREQVTDGLEHLRPVMAASAGSMTSPCGSPGCIDAAVPEHGVQVGSIAGPQYCGGVGPNSSTDRVPNAVARCATPVSPLTNSADPADHRGQRRQIQTCRPRTCDVRCPRTRQQRLRSRQPECTTPTSPGPPVTMIRRPDRAIRPASKPHRSTGQRRDALAAPGCTTTCPCGRRT